MKRRIFAIGVCGLVALVPAASLSQEVQRQTARSLVPPHINAAAQEYFDMAINLVLTGMRFPKRTTGDVWRAIRLVTVGGGVGGAQSSTFYAGETGNWTPTRVDDLLHFTIPAARRYKVGLVQYQVPGPPERTLISNEVEILILMNLDHIKPGPVPFWTTAVEVFTANVLEAQGSKIIKLGGQPAQVLEWGGPNPRNFKFGVPSALARPGVYELYVEENGIPVSRKIQVSLLGKPVPKGA